MPRSSSTPPAPADRHLVVYGLRASGKTSAGDLAASRLALPFVDLDDAVLERSDCGSVSQFWERHGQSAFRNAEAATLRELLDAKPPSVVALGGGTAYFEAAAGVLIDAMNRGVVVGPVYLHAPAAVLADRLRRDAGDRPSLTGGGVAGEAEAVYAERHPTYATLAGATIEVEHLTVDRVADRLVELWHAA
ncbi:MAG: shikimate kinase [Planctomycetota bacterium]